MARTATGSTRFRDGKWKARITLDGSQRELPLPTCRPTEEAKAYERTALLADLAARLTNARRADVAMPLLERAASRDGKQLADVVEAAKRICSGEAAPVSALVTFGEFAERWTSGALHKRYPDHVKDIHQDNNRERLAKYVIPIVGAVPLKDFTRKHADAVMSALPPSLAPLTRRHTAQVMSRVLTLAAFPGDMIERNPLPKGYLPKPGPRKAKGSLYPDEDARLMRTTSVELPSRLLYGFLAREGMRRGEAGRLMWADLDLARGAVKLDENKTDEPRSWALDPGVVRALSMWKQLRGDQRPNALVFVDADDEALIEENDSKIVTRFRRDLTAAGIDRAELFERSKLRMPIRVHDLRGTFVTIALANGKSETWVADRTGHKSSAMINLYRRAARQVSELGLGSLVPLDEAIPELRSAPAPNQGEGGLSKGDTSRHVVTGVEIAAKSDGSQPFATALAVSKSASRKGVSVRVRPRLSRASA